MQKLIHYVEEKQRENSLTKNVRKDSDILDDIAYQLEELKYNNKPIKSQWYYKFFSGSHIDIKSWKIFVKNGFVLVFSGGTQDPILLMSYDEKFLISFAEFLLKEDIVK